MSRIDVAPVSAIAASTSAASSSSVHRLRQELVDHRQVGFLGRRPRPRGPRRGRPSPPRPAACAPARSTASASRSPNSPAGLSFSAFCRDDISRRIASTRARSPAFIAVRSSDWMRSVSDHAHMVPTTAPDSSPVASTLTSVALGRVLHAKRRVVGGVAAAAAGFHQHPLDGCPASTAGAPPPGVGEPAQPCRALPLGRRRHRIVRRVPGVRARRVREHMHLAEPRRPHGGQRRLEGVGRPRSDARRSRRSSGRRPAPAGGRAPASPGTGRRCSDGASRPARRRRPTASARAGAAHPPAWRDRPAAGDRSGG